MGIRDILNSQNADFISLHDLLKEIERQENITYQEAAIFLYRLRYEQNFPKCYSFSALDGKSIASIDRCRKCLALAAEFGERDYYEEEGDDEIPF